MLSTFTEKFLRGPNALDQEDIFWLGKAEETIRRKTVIFRQSGFARGPENWLLLADKLSLPGSDWSRRLPMLRDLLQEFWGLDWYTKVVLQQVECRRFVVVTEEDEVWM